ncbi:MAG: PorV/PorQ family protein [Elusimicrobiales bacterium]|nr:PorV/PorQ family protein [Elusimicrobiales bacterium]
MAPTTRQLRTALFAFAAGLALAAPSRAGGPGSAGVQVLKTDVSPRAAGMAGAFAAVADDAYAANYNPAGLGQLYLPEASAMYLSGFDDAKLQYLSFAMPLPIQGLAGLDKPAIGVSALFSDSGQFLYSPIDGNGRVNAVTMDAEKTRVITFSYAEKVYADVLDLEGYKASVEQYLGFSAKYIGSELLESYSASAVAIDAGWLIRDVNLGLGFGASLSNLGSGLKYYKEAAPLPTILRLGASYRPPTIMSQSLLLALEGDFYLNEQLKSLRAGLEYHFQDMFNFRLGYRGAEDNKGPTVGLGINYESFALDFGLALGGEVFNSSQVSFSYKFAGWRTAEVRRTQRQFRDEAPAARPGKKAAPERRKPAPKPEKKKDTDFFWIY